MAKAPISGQVKTRLAREIGNTRALAVYQQLLLTTLALTQTIRQRLGWRIAWQITGQGTGAWSEDFFPSDHACRSQVNGDLGTRMQAAFAAELPQANAALMIGVDCPQLTLDYLLAAAKALEAADVVLGPAKDGGYVLIGMKKILPPLFNGPRWSSVETLNDTLKIAEKNGIVYDLRAELRDLDTASDLAAFPTFAKDFLPFDGTQGA